jgi:hypothetical protein
MQKSIVTKLLLLSAFLFSFGTSHAKKSFSPFESVISLAEVVVTGHISKVHGDSFYTFSVDQYVKGACNKQIKVKLFRSWTCDVRWQKAAIGQQLFLCLTKNGNNYETINESNGEFFIIGSKLRLFINYRYPSPFIEENLPKLDEVIVATKNFLNCYSMGYGYKFHQLKTEEEIRPLAKLNEFSFWLFGQIDITRIIKEKATAFNSRALQIIFG